MRISIGADERWHLAEMALNTWLNTTYQQNASEDACPAFLYELDARRPA